MGSYKYKYAVAIDVGGTNIRIAAIDTRTLDVRLPAAAELILVAHAAPGAGNLQHQCATPLAAPSSINAPRAKRSRPKSAINGCGVPVATVCAIVSPPAGIAL